MAKGERYWGQVKNDPNKFKKPGPSPRTHSAAVANVKKEPKIFAELTKDVVFGVGRNLMSEATASIKSSAQGRRRFPAGTKVEFAYGLPDCGLYCFKFTWQVNRVDKRTDYCHFPLDPGEFQLLGGVTIEDLIKMGQKQKVADAAAR